MVIASIVAWPAGSRSSLMQPMKSLDLNCRLGSANVSLSIHRSVNTAGLGPHAAGKQLSQLLDQSLSLDWSAVAITLIYDIDGDNTGAILSDDVCQAMPMYGSNDDG